MMTEVKSTQALIQHIKKEDGDISVSAYARLAIFYRELGELAACEGALKKGLVLHPDSGWLYLEYAQLEALKQDYKKSIAFWQKYYQLRGRKLDKRTGILNNFLKSAFLAGEIDLYEELASKALATHSRDAIYEIYMQHAACLQDIERRDFARAKKKLLIIQAKYKTIKQSIYFSIDYLKKQIDLKKCLLVDDKQSLENLAILIKYKSRVRIFSSDIIGIADYLEIKNKQVKKDYLLKIILLLRKIENIVLTTDEDLLKLKNSYYEENIALIAANLLSRELPADLLPSAAWMVLATYCAGGKHIQAYYKLRTLSQQSAAVEVSPPQDGFFIAQRARARAELQLPQYASDTAYLEAAGYADMTALLNLYYGNRAACIDYFAGQLTEDDKKFRDYLAGKSIAIVGPVDVGLNNGEEIDSYDVVIRFNFKGLEGYDKKKFGTKTHVSPYINGDLIKPENQAAFAYGMEQLEYATFQNASPTTFESMKHIKTPLRKALLVWNESKNPSFRSQLNAIQKLLADILRFPSGKIKIFNANLWIDAKTNPAYRAVSGITPGAIIWHDIISNFNFTKILWSNGHFETDEVLTKVLSMSEEEYAMAMAERYGR